MRGPSALRWSTSAISSAQTRPTRCRGSASPRCNGWCATPERSSISQSASWSRPPSASHRASTVSVRAILPAIALHSANVRTLPLAGIGQAKSNGSRSGALVSGSHGSAAEARGTWPPPPLRAIGRAPNEGRQTLDGACKPTWKRCPHCRPTRSDDDDEQRNHRARADPRHRRTAAHGDAARIRQGHFRAAGPEQARPADRFV